jgi:hypothetical protein
MSSLVWLSRWPATMSESSIIFMNCDGFKIAAVAADCRRRRRTERPLRSMSLMRLTKSSFSARWMAGYALAEVSPA